jgi:hypothetical protein
MKLCSSDSAISRTLHPFGDRVTLSFGPHLATLQTHSYHSCLGNRPLEPKALEVEFFLMEEVLHEKVKIH